MRRLFVVLVVAAATAMGPMTALAGNQKVAEQIAASLRNSGQLHAYKIGVKYQDGTAWIRGRVTSHAQMNAALRLVFQTPGVKRVVNNLSVESGQKPATATQETADTKPHFSMPNLLAAPLRQVAGAISRERRHQPISMAIEATHSQPVKADPQARRLEMAAASRPIVQPAVASPVPTTFAPAAVQPATATTARMKPTFAPAAVQPATATTARAKPTLAPPRKVVSATPRPTLVGSLKQSVEKATPPAAVVKIEPPAPAKVAHQQPTRVAAGRPQMMIPAAQRQMTIPAAQQQMMIAAAQQQMMIPAGQPQMMIPAGQPQMMIAAGQPIPIAYVQGGVAVPAGQPGAAPMPRYVTPVGANTVPARYDQPHMPNYAWPSYAAYPNYAGVAYPKQYSPTAWPYIGPFYPYPQVPLGWRKVTLEWHDGWWNLDFDDGSTHGPFSGLFRSHRVHH